MKGTEMAPRDTVGGENSKRGSWSCRASGLEGPGQRKPEVVRTCSRSEILVCKFQA